MNPLKFAYNALVRMTSFHYKRALRLATAVFILVTRVPALSLQSFAHYSTPIKGALFIIIICHYLDY